MKMVKKYNEFIKESHGYKNEFNDFVYELGINISEIESSANYWDLKQIIMELCDKYNMEGSITGGMEDGKARMMEDVYNYNKPQTGDFVDFGEKGKAYVVKEVENGYLTTDNESDRFNPDAEGKFIGDKFVKKIIDKGDDYEYFERENESVVVSDNATIKEIEFELKDLSSIYLPFTFLGFVTWDVNSSESVEEFIYNTQLGIFKYPINQWYPEEIFNEMVREIKKSLFEKYKIQFQYLRTSEFYKLTEN